MAKKNFPLKGFKTCNQPYLQSTCRIPHPYFTCNIIYKIPQKNYPHQPHPKMFFLCH